MSKILGRLEPIGHKNGHAVVLAIPDSKNGARDLADRYVIVAVDVESGEAVAARTGQINGREWDHGYYFNGTPDEVDDTVRKAIRKAIELAGYRLAD